MFLQKKFIEHNLFSSKSYKKMSKGRPRRTLILFELFGFEFSKYGRLRQSPSVVKFRLSPRTCSLCGSVAPNDNAHLFSRFRAYDVTGGAASYRGRQTYKMMTILPPGMYLMSSIAN